MQAKVKLDFAHRDAGYVGARGQRVHSTHFKTYCLMIDGVVYARAWRDAAPSSGQGFRVGREWKEVGPIPYITKVADLKAWWIDAALKIREMENLRLNEWQDKVAEKF